jgi:hypothetical protein
MPCEVTAYVAESNCIAEGRCKALAETVWEAAGGERAACRMTNPIRRRVAASLLV